MLIFYDIAHFTDVQRAGLHNVTHGAQTIIDGSKAMKAANNTVRALQDNLGDAYKPSGVTVFGNSCTVLCKEDVDMFVDELSAFMAGCEITKPVRIMYLGADTNECGEIIVNGYEDARYSASMVNKAMDVMEANAQITDALPKLAVFEDIKTRADTGELFIKYPQGFLVCTYSTGFWAVRGFLDAWDAVTGNHEALGGTFSTLDDIISAFNHNA